MNNQAHFINILSAEYSLRYKALELYLAGCRPPHCLGCHNPESWSFAAGRIWRDWQEQIASYLHSFNPLIDSLWVLGGEPLDQPRHELEALLQVLSEFRKPIWLWTRYESKDIPASVLRYCAMVKTGRYDSALAVSGYTSHGIQLASSNQKVIQVDTIRLHL